MLHNQNSENENFDRSGYIVITKNPEFQDGSEIKYYIMLENQFERMALSDSYGSYGQRISCSDAGDYLELLTQKAVDFANTYEIENDSQKVYTINDTITAYDDSKLFADLCEKCKEDIEIFEEMIFAHTYWDGSNWKTISIEVETGEPSHVRVSEETETEILKEYFEYDDYTNEGPGCRIANGEKYQFIESNWHGKFEIVRVELFNPEL